MNFASTFINRPVLSTVISIVIILFGVIGFTYLGVREFPSVDPPVVTVTTNYIGANADVMESQVTEVLEESINGIAGIRSISSISTDGRSTITVEFELEIEMEAAANDVRDRVSQAIRRLPPDIDPPIVVKADADAFPILSMTISSPNRSLLELTDIAINQFKERLQTIPGVSVINIWGEKKYAMKLQIDPARLSAYGLTPLDVRAALNRENVELPTGKIEGYGTELTIRTMGRLTTTAEFNDLILVEQGGDIIRFKDIGEAILLPENERTLLRGDYTYPQVAVAVTPQPGSNHIEIADEFYRRVEQIKKEAPDDLNYNIVIDSTRTIRTAIEEVQDTIILAFILVVLVIFAFLREWRTTLIPILAIPISLIGAFFIMYFMGFSINILTLLGIVLATGIVVDDAIVVMENIYSKIEKGMEPLEAGHKGTGEIVFAVISTTVTLIAVFLPIVFLQGLTGRLFREFGIVVAGAVVVSSIVSLTLTPMMSARILKRRKKRGKAYEVTERFFNWLTNGYASSLEKFMRVRWMSFPIMGLAVCIIVFIGRGVPSELAPLEDKSRLTINAIAPEGVSFELMDEYMKSIMRVLDSMPEKATALTVTSPSFGASTAANTGFSRVALTQPDQREKSQQQIADELTTMFKKMSFARTIVSQEQTIGADRRGGLPIQYVIKAPNFERLKEIVPVFMQRAQSDPAFQVVDLNLKFNKPELAIDIDRDRARALGVTVADIAETLQLFFSGQRFGYFILNNKQYQVIGQASRENRDEPLDLSSINVRNGRGELIQLDNLVKLSDRNSPPQLYRFNRYVSATVSALPAPGYTLGQGLDAMDRISEEVLDDSFSVSLSGTAKEFRESSNSLLFAFLLALVLVYLTLAAQFESFSDPLIIMFTVPLALAGAIISLWLFGQTLNIFSQIGIIVLIGIVTKNGILIVEFANQIKQKGLGLHESVAQSATQRFRPILMTSLATALGALPIALALGAASKSRIPMGIVIIGGLVFSLLLTLYVIPALYTYLSGRGKKMGTATSKVAAGMVLFLFVPSIGFSQQNTVLSLKEAIGTGLANNHDILISKNEAGIAANNNHMGNAGMLPTVDFVGGGTYSINDTRLQFFDGRTVGANDAKSVAVNASLQLNWTIYDGTKMFILKNRLADLEKLGWAQSRAVIENTVAEIIVAYYNIVQLEKYTRVIQDAIKLSRERLAVVEAKYRLGSGSELAVLQTRVDMNADSSNLLRQLAVLKNGKAALNRLLVAAPDNEVTVDTTISLQGAPGYDQLASELEDNNPELIVQRLNYNVAAHERKEADALTHPVVDLFGNYNFNRAQNEVGVLQSNLTYGPVVGLTARFNLYNGSKAKQAIRNADFNLENAREKLTQGSTVAKSLLFQAHNEYTSNRQIAQLELENLQFARKNVTIALERYKLGALSDVELREAQLGLIEAESRLLSAQFGAKAAEVELFRLTGSLLNRP